MPIIEVIRMPNPNKIKEDEVQVNWIIDGKLGQSNYPKPEDFDYLHREGIRAIVSIRAIDSPRDRRDARIIREKGFEYLGVYVKDFTAPTLDQIYEINKFIDNMININKPVLVHCLAAGRSGTVLTAYLMHKPTSRT